MKKMPSELANMGIDNKEFEDVKLAFEIERDLIKEAQKEQYY